LPLHSTKLVAATGGGRRHHRRPLRRRTPRPFNFVVAPSAPFAEPSSRGAKFLDDTTCATPSP
jgi:hypothetical protein